ncbi:serine hydrolase [Frankia sp. AgB32]|uniref:serine hydrolase domain-containing protein n=1 Tax=Frankia sp. AgB32 TaxID=631119 RepID=UPI00200F20E4|nr:serine hydrolase domain-containing protein [Frankia sp. AgB32]MCK9897711.1 beta-lactamase family protein [Frankia sp. AgB32]
MRRTRAALPVAAILVTAGLLAPPSSALAAPAVPATATTATTAADAGPTTDVDAGAPLDGVTAAGVPGALFRVEEHGRIRQGAVGVADLRTGAPLRAQARVRVGSITKTFVATVVLQLAGEGRLALDQPVQRWLPGLLRDGHTITVRQLLNHTSGLFDHTADPALAAGIVANRVFHPAQLVALAQTHPRSFAPGAGWAYSNTNYLVAGLLVEALTHHPLGQELSRRILTPLHLTGTSFPTTTGDIAGYHAHGYVPAELGPTPDGHPFDVTGRNPSAAWASGALISTAADLARFYRALLGGALLPAAMLTQMKTTVVEDPTDPRVRYGLGIERVVDPCGVNWGHGGAILGYESMALHNENTGRTIVLASTLHPAPPAGAAALTAAADRLLCDTPPV